MGTSITSPGLTVEDLGQKVKAKYPGQYDDLPDIVVGQRVKRKYSTDYGDFRDLSPHEVAMKTRAAQDAQTPEEPSQVNNFVSTLGGDIYKGLSAIPGALRHPIDTYNNIFDGIVSAGVDQGKQAISAFKNGELSRAAGHALAALPGFAPAANAGEEFASGDTGAGAAHTLELLGPSAAKYGARVLAPAMRNTTLGRIASNPEVRQSVMDAIPGGGKVLKAAQTIRKAAKAPAEIPTPLSGPEEFESLKPVVKAPLPENAPIGARTPVIRGPRSWESIPDAPPGQIPEIAPIQGNLPSGRTPGPAPARIMPVPGMPTPRGAPIWESIPDETSATPGPIQSIPSELPSGRKVGPAPAPEPPPARASRVPLWQRSPGAQVLPPPDGVTASAEVEPGVVEAPKLAKTPSSPASPASQILPAPQAGEHAFEAPKGEYVPKDHYVQRARTAKARGVAKWLQDKSPEEVQKLTPKEWDSHAQESGYSKMSPESRAIAIEEHQKLYDAKNPK